ncbi:hypothetical protein E1I69_08055 [Bacillus timonensis]|uniref:Uncharacterized protein n=1 Tax=Bacillus timonensis TaxID=1033734 RepID=A0A4S3PU20_9BACI|nr:hypothetical protein [Bacillus timonensis]THE13287.1 hypothetical protein E1I69_08055 [Bacillus timonensis]
MINIKSKGSNKFAFENERALCLTQVIDRQENNVTKKMVVRDKKMGFDFSVIIPLKLKKNGDVHHYPSKDFTVRGKKVGKKNTMAKYYESLGEWESFKSEFFDKYSLTVNEWIYREANAK